MRAHPRGAVTFAVAVVLAATGCATSPRDALTFDPGTGRGRVDYDFIPDPGRIVPPLSAGQELKPPRPLVTPLPEFPPGDQAAAAAPVSVVVRIVVGKDGLVGEAGRSPLEPGGDAAARIEPVFLQAAEDAVRTWQFVPAEIQTVKPGEDLDGDSKPDYTILVDARPVPAYLDVRFLFERVAGTGRVRVE